MRNGLLIVLLAATTLSACARRVPEPATATPGVPHVSWVIMSGDRDNPDREFVCQSEPRNECVVPASRPDDRVLSDVHIYYHGAGAETRYTGTIQIGYFAGSVAAHTVTTNMVVRKTESITNQSVFDIVTSKPGTYSIDLDLVATVTDTKKVQSIHENIRIVVK